MYLDIKKQNSLLICNDYIVTELLHSNNTLKLNEYYKSINSFFLILGIQIQTPAQYSIISSASCNLSHSLLYLSYLT